MKKLLIPLFILLLMTTSAYAKDKKYDFTKIIKNSGIDTSAISISVKSADSGNVVYKLNDKMLSHPASVQKLLTTPAAVDVLGQDYKFSTELYERGNGNYLIKLGADPYFTSKDLKTLISFLTPETRKIFIDDSILDDKTWGEGWQWDDDLNNAMPRFGAYNLDGNLVKLTLLPATDGKFAKIADQSKYPFVFINNVTNSNLTDISIKRDTNISSNTIILSGTIARPTTIYFPVNNIKGYFEYKLTQTLENRKIYLTQRYGSSTKQSGDKQLGEISHGIDSAVNDILKNSNNMTAEILFKVAGGGTDVGGVEMFNNYCKKIGIDNSRNRIVDGSGVSKNNLVSADFISEYLILNKNNTVLEKLPHPGEGTLTLRMLPIKNNLRAKTGTLADISSIAGYLTSKSGKNYAFCIIINDTKLSASDKKMLEDYIIREAYLKL